MTTQQYKYIKGREIQSHEHMPSATELANYYGLLTMNGKPNAALVAQVMADADNIRYPDGSADSHYYVHSHGVMKVYSKAQYAFPLGMLVSTLKDGEEYTYNPKTPGKRIIKFKYKKP